MHYRSHPSMGDGAGLVILVTLPLIVFTVVILGSVNGYRAVFARYDVTGTVMSEPGTKLRISAKRDGEAKFAVSLDTTGDGAADRVVNCTSTQCVALPVGSRVVLSCYEEWHVVEPNEEECRFSRMLAAAPKDAQVGAE